MDVLFHLNDWFGPLMAAGPLFLGAIVLIGEHLYTQTIRRSK
jgi:hypothetical protein